MEQLKLNESDQYDISVTSSLSHQLKLYAFTNRVGTSSAIAPNTSLITGNGTTSVDADLVLRKFQLSASDLIKIRISMAAPIADARPMKIRMNSCLKFFQKYRKDPLLTSS